MKAVDTPGESENSTRCYSLRRWLVVTASLDVVSRLERATTLYQTRMQSTHRHGDITGIAFLMALIAAAFVPAVLKEARHALPPGIIQRVAAVHHTETIRLVPAPSATALASIEIAMPSESSTAPANDFTRLLPFRDSLERVTPALILMPRAAGPPRSHEPRGPPAPGYSVFHV